MESEARRVPSGESHLQSSRNTVHCRKRFVRLSTRGTRVSDFEDSRVMSTNIVIPGQSQKSISRLWITIGQHASLLSGITHGERVRWATRVADVVRVVPLGRRLHQAVALVKTCTVHDALVDALVEEVLVDLMPFRFW